MKKYLILLLIFSSQLFSQTIENKNLLSLKSKIKSAIENSNFEIQPQKILETKKKNTGLAILYSLLLPGMGELYAENYSSGKYFTIADGALWGIYIGVNTYGNWQKDRYKSFAQANAGVKLEGKSEDYFATISEYLSFDEYNDAQALNREFDKMYKSASFNWDWSSIEQRRNYRSMWISSEQSFNNLRFVVGALLVNRIASAINAVRSVAAYNKRLSQDVSWNISAGVTRNINLPPSVTINFQTTF